MDRSKLDLFCQQWQIQELALFGSVLRDDFAPQSDIDVLVTFAPDAQWTLMDIAEMREAILGTAEVIFTPPQTPPRKR